MTKSKRPMGKETKPMFNLTNKQEKATETKNAWISFRLLANVSAKEYDNIKQEGGDNNGIQT